MAPDGSCTAAMLLPVAMTTAELTTPGTAGTRCARSAEPAAAGARTACPSWARFSRTGMRTLGAARCSARAARTAGAAQRTAGAALRTAGAARRTAGAGRLGARFARVEHQALADERVQRTLGQLRGRRVLHDVPHEHPVVGARQRMAVVADPDRALEPPVRRVQAV